MIAIGFRDKFQCLNRNVFIFLMSKFRESKVTFLESSASSGRDTGSHHGKLNHSVITENHSQSAYRKQSDCPVPSPIHTSTVQHLHLRLRSQREGGVGRAERLWEPEDQEISCEIVFWKCQKSYTHEGSAAWLPQPDLNEYNTNRQANIKDGNLMEATHIQRHRWSATKKVWEWEKHFSSGMSPVVGYPIPGDQLWSHARRNNTRQTEQVVFMFFRHMCGVVYAYICVYTTVIVKEKEAMIMKGSKDNTWEGLGTKGEVRI